MAYDRDLPLGLLVVNLVFHVLMIKKYHYNGYHVLQWDLVDLDRTLICEENPLAILDR